MVRRCRIWTVSTTWRHPSCCYRSRERQACEFADFVIANFTSDNVFSHSLNLSKVVVVRPFTLPVKCSEIVQADTTCRTVYTTSSVSLFACYRSSSEDHARWYHEARWATRVTARNLGHTVPMLPIWTVSVKVSSAPRVITRKRLSRLVVPWQRLRIGTLMPREQVRRERGLGLSPSQGRRQG